MSDIKNPLRQAEIQERWGVRIAFLSVALGVAAGWFNVPLGLALGLPGLILSMWMRSDADFLRMWANQCAVIRLQHEALLNLARRVGAAKTP